MSILHKMSSLIRKSLATKNSNPAQPSIMMSLVELTKPRICMLALFMSLLGYEWARPSFDLRLFFSLLGIGLIGASSGVFNMLFERENDKLMKRTQNRPIPSGRIHPKVALWFGIISFIGALLFLIFFTNTLTVLLAIGTHFFYIFIYTPSKRKTSLSTLLGAIPGAMPPVLGWTAGVGELSLQAYFLFGLLFLWQIPHFLAISWIYREDYRQGRFPMLTVLDNKGSSVTQQIFLYLLILLPCSLLPTVWGYFGIIYFFGALILGLIFIATSIIMTFDRSIQAARRIFMYSIIYLPLMGILMMIDKR